MKIKTDHIGIVLSCTCLIHCLALPFILLAMGIYNDNELIHGIFLVFAMAVTSHAIFHSYRKHCKHIVIFFGFVGLLFLGLDLFVGHGDHAGHVHGHSFTQIPGHEPSIDIYAVIGSMFLIATHLLNLYYNRQVKKCHACK